MQELHVREIVSLFYFILDTFTGKYMIKRKFITLILIELW